MAACGDQRLKLQQELAARDRGSRPRKALALQKRVNELQETVRNDEARIAALRAAAAAKSAGTISLVA